MAKRNSTNTDITINADGFSIAGGVTPRELDISGADIAMVGSGSNTYTFPASSSTLRPEIPGIVEIWPMKTAPTGWLICDGSAISRSTYATLFGVLVPSLGNPTISIASPGVVTLNGHGMDTGDMVYFTTTGALPTGITANTIYWVIKNDANTFWIASSKANADAGTKINTSGTQSGTHTVYHCPYGLGDGSTTFNLPNVKGKVLVGTNAGTDTEFEAVGNTYGEKTHLLTSGESGVPAHTHPLSDQTLKRTAGGSQNLTSTGAYTIGVSQAENNSAANASSAHNNIQPSLVINYIIKY